MVIEEGIFFFYLLRGKRFSDNKSLGRGTIKNFHFPPFNKNNYFEEIEFSYDEEQHLKLEL